MPKECRLEKLLSAYLSSRKNEEEREQVKVFDWIRAKAKDYPCLDLAFHVPNGGSRNIVAATRLKRMGTKRGMPDICIPIASRKRYDCEWNIYPTYYHGLWIEMKSKKGNLSKDQKAIRELLQIEGHLVYTCHDSESAIKIIKEYLNIV